ncbi:hypothetical protein TNCV_767711 [Trichonephila clavipes]|nr:hypothetical protein TNCV_767711 [Trichonephila clavipes]
MPRRHYTFTNYPCLLQDSNPDPMAPQSVSLTTIPDGWPRCFYPPLLAVKVCQFLVLKTKQSFCIPSRSISLGIPLLQV